MARDLKVIQRGMNVQGNDLALPAGSPVYALNASFTRDGVAERRAGFERFWDGLPQYQICALNEYGKFHELFSKQHLFMPANGLMFTYDTVSTEQWYSVPVDLPHRMQTLYDVSNSLSGGRTTFHTLGRAVIAVYQQNSTYENRKPLNWQSSIEYSAALSGTSIIGTIGNDTSQATDATATQNLKFIECFDIVADSSSRLLFSDNTNIRICTSMDALNGTVLFCGSITVAGYVDATTTSARFSGASWMAADGSGNVYVADNVNAIRKINSAGVVTTLAGSITAGDVDGVGTAARFRNISGLAWSGSFLFVSEGASAHRIRKVDVTTGSVTIFAGPLSPASGYTNATGTAARFNTPIGLEYSGGFLYTGDTSNNAVRQITTAGAVVTTFAGGTGKATASAARGLVGGPGDLAQMPSVTVRSLYTAQPLSGSNGIYLCIECSAPNSSTDLAFLYIDRKSVV